MKGTSAEALPVAPHIAAQLRGLPQKHRNGSTRAVAQIVAQGPNRKRKEDRNVELNAFIVRVTDVNGDPAVGETIVFVVLDPENTGTGFIAEGIPHPVGSSLGISYEGGTAVAEEWLRLGAQPGRVVVRAYANFAGEGPYADFEIEVAEEVPHSVVPFDGGYQSFQAGAAYPLDLAVRVTDERGDPIDFGEMRFYVEDPNGTGSFLTVAGGMASYYATCDMNGVARIAAALWVGDGVRDEFYVRAKRLGAGNEVKYFDVPYISV